ncbi:flagellar motor protein MotB [Sphingomonas sp. LHG3443-2]|uniref:flagellar motor protein MotB n=1 Tax=Sphingomonas sp. LHG3443-2 TaxID=2804639 RepID=UPI003CE7EB30
MATNAAPNQRPIVIRKVKKVVGGHHGGAWKVAYADFVTAMMAFFMLLWLLSSPDEQKLKGLAEYFSPSTSASGEAGESMAAASSGPASQSKLTDPSQAPAGGSPSRSPAATAGAQSGGSASVPDPTLRIVAEELKLLLQPTSTPLAERQTIQMEQNREGLRISLMDDMRRSMFRPGTAELNTYARFMLAEVAKRITKTELRVAIEGHTDNVGGSATGNWQLSSARALAARSALVDAGFPAPRIAEVVALADTQPVYPDQPGRPENRRITIVLLAEGSPLPDIRSLGR